MAAPDDDELDLELDAAAEGEPEEERLDATEQGDESEQTSEQPATEREPAQDQERPAEQPERAPSRGENRFQALRNENQRIAHDLSETQRRLDEITRTMQRPAGETPEARAQRHALMTPQEIMQETLRESEGRMAQQLQAMQMQNFDTADRMAFQAKAATKRLYAQYGPKVEGKLAELRAQGKNAEREVILRWMIGDAAIERLDSKEGKREVQQGAQRLRAQKVRPSNSGSDTAADRRQQSSVERRLENVQI